MNYTNTFIRSIPFKYNIFYCDYNRLRGRTSNGSFENPVGPLGIIDVDLINIQSNKGSENWNSILFPAVNNDGYFNIEKGPDIQIKKGWPNKVTSIIFNISDLNKTEIYLKNNNMYGKTEDGIIYVDPKKCYGMLFGIKVIKQ